MSLNDLVSQKNIVLESDQRVAAFSRENKDRKNRSQLRISIPLDTARSANDPLYVGGTFSGLYVQNSSTSGSVKVSPTLRDQGQIGNYISIQKNDSINYSEAQNGLYFFWDAQAGKSLDVVLFLGVEFRSGTLNSAITGGVVVTEGTSFTPSNAVTVANTATLLSAANSLRLGLNIQVPLSSPEGIWIGDSSVVTDSGGAGTKIGIYVPVGGSFSTKNQGAFYAISSDGAAIAAIAEET